MEIAPRWARPWRWLALLGAVALLAAMPAVVSALPVSAPSLSAAELLARVRGSTATPYQGYAESRASLGLPDLPVVGRQTALLGSITRIRAWVASPTLWRVDELTAIGERDLYQDESGTLEWDSGSNRVERTVGEPVVRFARAADLLPTELGRRLAAAATPGEARLLAPRRVASAASTYGRGYDLVAALAFPARISQRARDFLAAVPSKRGPWGQASEISTPLLNAMVFERDGAVFALSGTVGFRSLEAIATQLARQGVAVR